jgi:hypothetical protein
MDTTRAGRVKLFLLLLATLFASAAAAPNSPLVGAWESTSAGTGTPLTLLLRDDGSGKLGEEEIQYSVQESRLLLTISGDTVSYSFVLKGDALTLSGGDLERPATFTRKSAPTGKGLGARLQEEQAGAPRSPSPVGTWELKAPQGSVAIVLNADGTGSMSGTPLRWALEGRALSLTLNGVTVSYDAAFTATTFTMSGGDLIQPVAFRRAGAPQQADTGIVGTWRAANGSFVEFRADGTGQNARGAFRYSASDGALQFSDGQSTVMLSYRLEGDRLMVTSNGDTATFTRGQAQAAAGSRPASAARTRNVVINKTRLTDEQIQATERQFQVRVMDGEFWYDRACGAWGLQGGPTVGFLPARLELGGPLQADASGGNTGVFFNGRELHPLDVAALQQITVVQPGRYWIDERGNCGFEGNPTPLVNLVQLANAARARGGGSYLHRNDITGIGSGGDGNTSYVMGKDWSVVIGD